MANVTLDEWVTKTQNRIETVIQTAAQDLYDEVQKPTIKGGNMPVITSFLRNSGQAKIGSLPSGHLGDQAMNATATTINRLKPGDTLYLGWTAKYARKMENKYAFVRRATQNWRKIVDNAAAKVKREVTR